MSKTTKTKSYNPGNKTITETTRKVRNDGSGTQVRQNYKMDLGGLVKNVRSTERTTFNKKR